MSILISDKVLIDRIQELAEEKHQSPEEVVAAAVAAYAAKKSDSHGDFWQSMIGHFALRHFITGISIERPRIEGLILSDYARLAAILHEYANLRLDFADAAIMAIAERLNVQHILTLDRRNFRVLRPQHCAYFELLP